MSDLKLSTSALPGLQIAPTQLGAAEAAVYVCPAASTFLGDVILTNVTGGPVTASVSLVKSGGAASASNRRISRSLAAGETAVLSGVKLAPGDFVSGLAGSASSISVLVDGVVFSTASAGAPTGINFEGVAAARVTGTGTLNKTLLVGSYPNRYLIVGVLVSHANWVNNEIDYTTLSVTSDKDGALTRLVSGKFGPGSQISGTVHWFGRANPTPGTHTLTATATKTGITIDQLQMVAESWFGVGSVNGAVAVNYQSGALSLPVASAAGNRALFCAGFGAAPTDFNQQIRHMNGAGVSGDGDWVVVADGPGAATVTAATGSTGNNFGVGVNLVPA